MAYGLWRRFSSRGGQILIPSLLAIPSLLLFIYLIFETTKISREKIRQQFAVDSAAFIQMGDYTNLLNRTAYVNGAFPYRIFKEAYECPPSDYLQLTDDSGQICPYDMLYAAGAFPKYRGDQKGQLATALDKIVPWEIEFETVAEDHGKPRPKMNTNPPEPESEFTLITNEQGKKIYVFWDPAAGVYKFYAQVYSLLGSVEESQITVFERLTDNFNFFRKSYYLNANTCDSANAQSCGNDGLEGSSGFIQNRITRANNKIKMYFIEKIRFFAKVPQSGLPPYFIGETNPPMDMRTAGSPDGLFQLAAVKKEALEAVGDGYQVYQGWDLPKNYFNEDFRKVSKEAFCEGILGRSRPCVHAMVTSQCPNLQGRWSGSEENNCVWPNPTPKYQTRLFP